MKVDPREQAPLQTYGEIAQSLLDRFFSEPNLFKWKAERESSAAVPVGLRDAIERFERGVPDRPVLLPTLTSDDTCITWALICADERQLRTADAEFSAFVGSAFVERLAFDDPSNSATCIRQALRGCWPHVQLFRSTCEARNNAVTHLWSARWRLWAYQPDRPTLELRTFSQLRAVFDRALLARNEQAAMDAMLALRHAHGLSAENRTFLEVRLAAAFGRWRDILDHTQWSQLLYLRLPPETYGDVWDAIYESFLRQHELKGQLKSLVEAFGRDVSVMATPLLRALGTSHRPAALKAFVLHEIGQATPSLDLLNSLIARLPEDAFGACTPDVQAFIDQLPPNRQLESALAELDKERYEQAYAMLWPLNDSAPCLTALLRCAREIDDPDRALNVLQRLRESSQYDELKGSRPRLIEAVERIAQNAIAPAEAVQALDQSASTAVDRADDAPPDQAQARLIEWWRELARSDGDVLTDQPKLMDQLIAQIESGAIEGGTFFEALLPIWFEWLVDRTAPRARLIPVYSCFVEGLFARNQLGDSELELIRRATTHLLKAGPRPEQYQSHIGRLIDIFQEVRSLNALNWALDVADSLSCHPCRDESARQRWLSALIDAALQHRDRMSIAQLALLRMVAQDGGVDLSDQFPHSSAYAAQDQPTGLRILIYSLDEQANQRAALALQEVLSSCRIDVNADDSCSKRLHNATKSSDYVAFVSTVATHAAFFCIKNAISSSGALLQVAGSGTTRIVQTVLAQVLH